MGTPAVVHILVRIVSVVGAVACFYGALLLYEDAQGRIQNRLEDWWIRLADTQQAALSRATRFMQGIAAAANRCFRRSLWRDDIFPSIGYCFGLVVSHPLFLNALFE